MFQAFFDDSGNGVPVFVLSGYVSRLDWWEEFSREWDGLLSEAPKLPYFKMREAVNGFGGRMKQPAANERIQKFLSLIALAAHASVSCVIPIGPYIRHLKGNIKKEWDDPYFIAIFDVLMKLLDNQAATESEYVVELIFDDNPRLAAKVPQWYQQTRALILPEYSHLIGSSPKFEDDKEFLPLQAADAQSWYFRRLFSEKLSGQPFPEDVPKSLFQELDNIPSVLSLWDSDRLHQMATKGVQSDKRPPRYKNIHDLIDNVQLDELI